MYVDGCACVHIYTSALTHHLHLSIVHYALETLNILNGMSFSCMSVHVVCACACAHVASVCIFSLSACLSLTSCLFSLQSAAECSSLLRTLHGLEQEHVWKSLALHQEEDFAQAHRQLAVFQRTELHGIFFAQIKNAIFKGELKPEAAKTLLQDYSKLQVIPSPRLP